MPDLEIDYIRLYGFGPFELPQKDRWIIVGSGPSSDHFDRALLDDPKVGVICLNSSFVALGKCDVAMFGHYESVVHCWAQLDRCGICFISDPLHVGYRCFPVPAVNLFNYADIVKFFGNKIRWFEKDSALPQVLFGERTLFCHHSIATTALHLLAKNGVRSVEHYGIDGGTGFGAIHESKDYDMKFSTRANYDSACKEFNDVAQRFRISLAKGKI